MKIAWFHIAAFVSASGLLHNSVPFDCTLYSSFILLVLHYNLDVSKPMTKISQNSCKKIPSVSIFVFLSHVFSSFFLLIISTDVECQVGVLVAWYQTKQVFVYSFTLIHATTSHFNFKIQDFTGFVDFSGSSQVIKYKEICA